MFNNKSSLVNNYLNKSNKVDDPFETLSKKLRMEKYKKEEIQKIKNEAIQNDKLKSKKKKCVQIIQKIFRGFLVRKKFRNIIEDLNTELVIEYFREKKLKRIKENAKEIIKFYLNKYIDGKRNKQREFLKGYYSFCADIISKHWRAYKTKKVYKKFIMSRKRGKDQIMKYINSYKIRLILRTNKLQDLLIEIANVKKYLNNLYQEEIPSERNEKLYDELSKKLPKLQSTFYEEFYLMKRKKWVNFVKVKTHWLTKYISIIYGNSNQNELEFNKNIDTKNNTRKKNKLEKNNNKNHSDIEVSYKEEVKKDETIPDYEDEFKANTQEQDDRPIKGCQFNSYNWEEYPENNINLDEEPKIYKKAQTSKAKKPKYDARKAIEEAKNKENEPEKVEKSDKVTKNEKKQKAKKDRDAFRNFLKAMKEEKNDENAESDIKIDKKNEKSTNIEDHNQKFPDKQSPKPERKNKRIELSMRKKLVELEKSPPPKVDIKNIKSRVDCWVDNNSNQTNNIKKIKKNEEPEIFKQKEYSDNFIEKIENDYVSLQKSLNFDDFLYYKNEKLKQTNIPYIKRESFYIKHYSSEIYEQLLVHLSKHYEELKN